MKGSVILGLLIAGTGLPGISLAEIHGGTDLGLQRLHGIDESAKYLEYRDIPEGLAGNSWLSAESGTWFLDIRTKGLDQEDQELSVELGKVGLFTVEGGYRGIVHRFIKGGLTPYSGAGTRYLSVPNAMQADLQASNSALDLANTLITDYLPSFNKIDLGLTRRQSKLAVKARLLKGLKVSLGAGYERRQGTRPFGASFGFGAAIEVPEPINYDTTQLKGNIEYVRGRTLFQAEGTLSNFENRFDVLEWDNPFRAVDGTSTSAYSANYASGATMGRIDLYPDNLAYSGSALGRVELPRNSSLVLTGIWGRRFQNDPLIPYTTNTAIKPGAANNPPIFAADLDSLPEERNVNARIDTEVYSATLAGRPLPRVRVKGSYRYQGYHNKISPMEFLGWVAFDATWHTEAEETEPTGYLRRKASASLGLDLVRNTALNLDYSHEIFERSHREVARSLEDMYKVSLNASPLSWLELRPTFERSHRQAQDYDYRVPFDGATVTGQLPFLRKFDEATRERRRVGVLASLDPWDPLSVTATYLWGNDDFSESPFGLLGDRHKVASVDADYSWGTKLTVYASFTREIYASDMKARQWTPNGVGDPYYTETGYDSDSNWTENDEDRIDTTEAGLEIPKAYKDVAVRLSYSESHSNGKIVKESPVGGPTDANNFVPLPFDTVDETTTRTASAEASRAFGDRLKVVAGYNWEWFNYADYNTEGFTNIPVLANGNFNSAVLIGALPAHYVANFGYLRLSMAF